MKDCQFLCNSMSPFSMKKVYGGESDSDTDDASASQVLTLQLAGRSNNANQETYGSIFRSGTAYC
jgi:hypothetical protein